MSLKKNTGWNLAGSGVPLLVGLFSVPYLVKNLGVEAFGILTLIWALIGYFSLFDFGLGRALTQQIAKRIHTSAVTQVSGLARLGLSIGRVSCRERWRQSSVMSVVAWTVKQTKTDIK